MPNLSEYVKLVGEPVRSGQSLNSTLTASRINGIIGAIRLLASGANISAGYGLLRKGMPNGVLLSVSGRGVAGASIPHPFKVYDASDGKTAKIRVGFGQVNSQTPMINGYELDADPEDPPLLRVDTGAIYLAVVLNDDGLITSCSIHNNPELPTSNATHGYLTLATVNVKDNAVTAINQSVTHSLGHQKCGSSTHNFWGL